jgi:hypothetical protein
MDRGDAPSKATEPLALAVRIRCQHHRSWRMNHETRAMHGKRERRDGRDGWEHRVRQGSMCNVRAWKFRKTRTMDLEPLSASLFPRVSLGYPARGSLLSEPPLFRKFLLQSPIRCYDEPSASGLAPRTLTVLLGTGALLFGACPRLRSGTGTAADGRASPLRSAHRSRDAAQRFRDEPS